ncbi:MAG: protein TolQ [Candidatus Desulfofervidus sp.]|nr:protein TolQ [Candidatus Desulfofervidus sp.]
MWFSQFDKSMIYQMIIHAGPMAKLVLIVLTLMSVFSWTVMINRWLAFKKVNKQGKKFLEIFWRMNDFKLIFANARKYKKAPQAVIFQSAFSELKKWTTNKSALVPTDNKTIFESCIEVMRKSSQNEYLRLRQGLGFLATVGNTAPFIGLFGTVWGIMRAFHEIGLRGSASLADVAPGISEALIATAFGLAAAIPAVIGYNHFTQRLYEQRTGMEMFMTDLLNRIKITYWSKGHDGI